MRFMLWFLEVLKFKTDIFFRIADKDLNRNKSYK